MQEVDSLREMYTIIVTNRIWISPRILDILGHLDDDLRHNFKSSGRSKVSEVGHSVSPQVLTHEVAVRIGIAKENCSESDGLVAVTGVVPFRCDVEAAIRDSEVVEIRRDSSEISSGEVEGSFDGNSE